MRKDGVNVSASWDRRDIVLGVYAREEVPVEFGRHTRSDKVIGKVTVVHGGPFERGGLEGLEDFDPVSDEGRPFGDPILPGIERALDQRFVDSPTLPHQPEPVNPDALYSLGLTLASPDGGYKTSGHLALLRRLAQVDLGLGPIVAHDDGEDRVDLVLLQKGDQGGWVGIVRREDTGAEMFLFFRVGLQKYTAIQQMILLDYC